MCCLFLNGNTTGYAFSFVHLFVRGQYSSRCHLRLSYYPTNSIPTPVFLFFLHQVVSRISSLSIRLSSRPHSGASPCLEPRTTFDSCATSTPLHPPASHISNHVLTLWSSVPSLTLFRPILPLKSKPIIYVIFR